MPIWMSEAAQYPPPRRWGTCAPTAVGGDRAQRGWMGLPAPTLEGGYLPYTGQLVVRDHWGLPELQVGLPGDKKGSKTKKVGQTVPGQGMPSRATLAFSLSTYCAPAAKQEAEAQRERGPCPRSHSVCQRAEARPWAFLLWHLAHGGWEMGFQKWWCIFIAPADIQVSACSQGKGPQHPSGLGVQPSSPQKP